MQAQDPGELFDLCDRSGAPLGRTKARALVHRDGDWHRSVHVWVVLRNGLDGDGAAPWLLFQRRSAAKDTWPGALDVAVAGHLRAGETFEDALREADEEIGLSLTPSDVVRIGLRRRAYEHLPGVRDNELQDVFAAITGARLRELRACAAEVDAIVALPFEVVGPLLRGEHRAAVGRALALHPDGAISEARVELAELIPADDGYYLAAHASLAALLGGARPAAWEIG